MNIEQWMSLIPGDKIKTAELVREVEEKDGKIGWKDGHGAWFERWCYDMKAWEKI